MRIHELLHFILIFLNVNSVPVQFQTTPPPLITLKVGEEFITTCKAVGVPIPEISWRLNWGHVPSKCEMTSVDGLGTLTCPDIQVQYCIAKLIFTYTYNKF